MRAACVGALILSCVLPAIDAAHAQSTGSARLAPAPNTPREQFRATLNENVVYLMGGKIGGGYNIQAFDISEAVNDGYNLRVLPVTGGAGVQNVRDVVFLRGVDLGLTNVLTLNKMKRTGELGPNLDQLVAYLAVIATDTLHVVARPEINTIEDLRGKRVSFNNAGSSTAEFSPDVFKMLKIDVQVLNMPQGDALEKMRAGELEATVCSCPAPLPVYTNAKSEWGFKFISIPFTPDLENASYYPAALEASQYPNLFPHGSKVESIATSSVLITFNWQPGTIRYNRVAKFTDAFFSKFENLLKPPRHPMWKTVNLAGTVPGWRRFPAAQEWLDNAKREETASLRGGFRKFIGQKASQLEDATDPAVQERLFKQFIEWARTTKAR